MSDIDPGVDRHLWETRYADLEDDLVSDPVDALEPLLDLVEEMLTAAGYEDADIEVATVVQRAAELIASNEEGEDVRADDAQQAIAELRLVYRGLIDSPETDPGADLRLHPSHEQPE